MIITGICLLSAMLYVIAGFLTEGFLKVLISGYLLEILLPMSIYLTLQIVLRRQYQPLKSRFIGGAGAFFFGLITENLQFVGIHFLGSTWDPMDLVMYIIGITLGLAVDLLVLGRFERSRPN